MSFEDTINKLFELNYSVYIDGEIDKPYKILFKKQLTPSKYKFIGIRKDNCLDSFIVEPGIKLHKDITMDEYMLLLRIRLEMN